MTQAKKLPSGTWRAFAQYYDESGVRHRKSITAKTEAEANYKAEQFEKKHVTEKTEPEDITFNVAIDDYISARKNLLSPSTIRGYRVMQRSAFKPILDKRIKSFDADFLQRFFNKGAETYSAKSLQNQYRFLRSVISAQKREVPHILLKPIQKVKKRMLERSEIIKIIEAFKGSRIELQVLCAIMLGMRQSEIAAVKWECIRGNYIEIFGAIVPGENSKYVAKEENKNYSSARVLTMPKYLAEKFAERRTPDSTGLVFSETPVNVLAIFKKTLKENDLPPVTMHDLRHTNSAIMLQQGIPDKYAMERGGWATDYTIKKVYQYTFSEDRKEVENKMNDFFDNLTATKKKKIFRLKRM